jgi:hypothetical protein
VYLIIVSDYIAAKVLLFIEKCCIFARFLPLGPTGSLIHLRSLTGKANNN